MSHPSPAKISESSYDDDSLPRQYRSLFPICERYVYMNHASVSPLSRPVHDAMAEMLSGVLHHGARRFEQWEQFTVATRAAAARLVNTEPHHIAFLRNTSEGLSAIANGLPWRAGDNVVSTAIEFPANIYPWMRIASLYGVELRLQPQRDGRINTDELLSLVDERTRVLTVSWVQFSTGQRLDLQRLGRFCRDRNILFVVDAVQGLGAFQLDVEKDCVDAFAASAHKFMLGPKGVALLYLSDIALERVKPTVIGWTAVNGFRDYLIHELDFRDGAYRFEGGSLNEAGICGLGQSIELFLKAGPACIQQHLLSLVSYLARSLQDLGYRITSPSDPDEASAILFCDHPRYSADEVCSRLDQRGIIVSARLNRLRIAPHFYNTHAEVDTILAALPK